MQVYDGVPSKSQSMVTAKELSGYAVLISLCISNFSGPWDCLFLLSPLSNKNMHNKPEKKYAILWLGIVIREHFAWYCLFVMSTDEEICILYIIYKHKKILIEHLGECILEQGQFGCWVTWVVLCPWSKSMQWCSSDPSLLRYMHHKNCYLCLWGPDQAYSHTNSLKSFNEPCKSKPYFQCAQCLLTHVNLFPHDSSRLPFQPCTMISSSATISRAGTGDAMGWWAKRIGPKEWVTYTRCRPGPTAAPWHASVRGNHCMHSSCCRTRCWSRCIIQTVTL